MWLPHCWPISYPASPVRWSNNFPKYVECLPERQPPPLRHWALGFSFSSLRFPQGECQFLGVHCLNDLIIKGRALVSFEHLLSCWEAYTAPASVCPDALSLYRHLGKSVAAERMLRALGSSLWRHTRCLSPGPSLFTLTDGFDLIPTIQAPMVPKFPSSKDLHKPARGQREEDVDSSQQSRNTNI